MDILALDLLLSVVSQQLLLPLVKFNVQQGQINELRLIACPSLFKQAVLFLESRLFETYSFAEIIINPKVVISVLVEYIGNKAFPDQFFKLLLVRLSPLEVDAL
jgi:hypothetical protein